MSKKSIKMTEEQIIAATSLWYKLWEWPEGCLTEEWKERQRQKGLEKRACKSLAEKSIDLKEKEEWEEPSLAFSSLSQFKNSTDEVVINLATEKQKELLKIYSTQEESWFTMLMESEGDSAEEYCRKHYEQFRNLHQELRRTILAY